MRCRKHALGGPQCELDEGHDGKHSVAWPDGGTFTFGDKEQSDLLRRYGGTAGT